MREIDQALARGYGVSPSPSARAAPPTPPVPPGPHFSIEPPDDARGAAARSVESPTLSWPPMVLTLERAHGDRFAQFAASLIEARDRRHTKVILFTSCHRAEGRTTLVLTLARALARHPGRTLLLDGDLAGPMLARQLGLRPRVGLDDVMEQDLAVADALIEAPDDHLTILPLRAPVSRPREALASPSWSNLMGRVRREFDLVLIDGSPVFTGMSAAILPKAVDAAVLVHHATRTPERTLLRARDVLDAAGIPLLGLAETFC